VARASRAVVKLEWTDAGRVLEGALAGLKARVEQTGAQVTHEKLPALLADPRLLESLFLNLVGNALKYRGADPPRIHIAAARHGAHWVLSVQDNGIGIATRYHGLIFDMFQRLDPKPGERSTGVGLAICRRIVERHGGRIWVQSAPQRGATFFFSLPAGGGRADG
jgi:light-regulated signal transduction histidine kinase (bacteriophytochrome)